MNREIKFRAWVFSMKKMFHWGSDLIKIHHNLSWDSLTEGSFNDKDSVLMQFTGLHDSEGKEIYEGDILEGTISKWKVVFKNGSFILEEIYSSDYLAMFKANFYIIKIIGNIYENPNLIS